MTTEEDETSGKLGQPSIADRYNEPTSKVTAILTDSQKQHLVDTYYGIANGIRILIDRDMQLKKYRSETDSQD